MVIGRYCIIFVKIGFVECGFIFAWCFNTISWILDASEIARFWPGWFGVNFGQIQIAGKFPIELRNQSCISYFFELSKSLNTVISSLHDFLHGRSQSSVILVHCKLIKVADISVQTGKKSMHYTGCLIDSIVPKFCVNNFVPNFWMICTKCFRLICDKF